MSRIDEPSFLAIHGMCHSKPLPTGAVGGKIADVLVVAECECIPELAFVQVETMFREG